jgi:hypothetical protein
VISDPDPTVTDPIRKKFGVSQNQRDFIEWLATPEPSRVPATIKDWAAERGVHHQTPTHWKRDRWFRAAWDMRLQELNIDPDRIQRLVDAIYEKALKGDVPAQKLYLEYSKGFAPVQKVEVHRAPSELSDEELAAELDLAAHRLRSSDDS